MDYAKKHTPRDYGVIRKEVDSFVQQRILEGKIPIAYTQTIDRGTLFGIQTPRGQYRRTAPRITKLLSRATEFVLVPEFRRLTGEIHYHGIIFITNSGRWLRLTRRYLKNEGFICLKYIDNMEKWIDYFTKEAQLAEELLNRPMPIVDLVPERGPAPSLPSTTKAEETSALVDGESGFNPEELPQVGEAGQGADLVQPSESTL